MKTIIITTLGILFLAACKKDDKSKANDVTYADAVTWCDRVLIGARSDAGFDTIQTYTINFQPIVYFRPALNGYYAKAYFLTDNQQKEQQDYGIHLFEDSSFTKRFGGTGRFKPCNYVNEAGQKVGQDQTIIADFPPFNSNVPGGVYIAIKP